LLSTPPLPSEGVLLEPTLEVRGSSQQEHADSQT
jgi:hypothetical protein